VPLPLVVSVVVFLLLVAALCGAIAILTILRDLRASGSPHPVLQPPPLTIPTAPAAPRPLPVVPPRLATPPALRRRRVVPPGVPLFPPPLPRGAVMATPMPRPHDEDEEDDYTEVDDGVTILRDARLAVRR
jgi:hypothetical protein